MAWWWSRTRVQAGVEDRSNLARVRLQVQTALSVTRWLPWSHPPPPCEALHPPATHPFLRSTDLPPPWPPLRRRPIAPGPPSPQAVAGGSSCKIFIFTNPR
ncbi:hypothetical protein DEO72_LG8g2117 [Vigna unguiculata]|uniref:Uncharacterized protein n=1 Tax=Vigna unguiculata TaxID=3917 RepID=A0A4D6MTI3_VIGUN|nr:hypothetical protein DEO72_LG8g2117 [Vigna unguiculata]